jgi:DNA-binding transcriptional LysR family regulator
MKYSLRQLEVFLATARHENLSRAARELNMSQSAASDSLKELEHQFDIQLFDRIGKRLQLNDFGRVLQPRAEELLERAKELEFALGKHQDMGVIKVGATMSIGNYLAIPLIVQYRSRYPEGQVKLTVDNTEQISHQVANFTLDVGMIEGEIHNDSLEIVRWQEDELQVFCSASHPLAKKGKITDRDIRSQRWILREQGSGTRQTFDRAMHDMLPELTIDMELEHTEAIKRAVESGLGLGCLSRITIEDGVRSGRFVALDLKGRDLKRSFYLIWHKDKYMSAAIQHWIELCLGQ